MARPTDKRWKGIIIDWPTIADMDANDYELKPLNQQQVAILLALLEYQKWPTRWTGLEMSKSELETYIADIEQRLMRNEGEGMATKDDIRDGMYEAMNRLAAQIVSGRYTNIVVGEDGTVTDPTTEDPTAGLPEDDPSTPIDETASANMGGCISLSRGIELLLDKIDTYYGATNGTPTTPLADAQTLIKAYFDCDGALMDTSIAAYYTYRGSNPQINFTPNQAMQLFLYCHGANERGWQKWLVDSSGYAVFKLTTVQNLTIALNPEFWTTYFNQGTSKPSTVYFEASCVPSPTEVINYTTLGAAVNSQTAWKNSHRLLFTVENYFTDSLGNVLDFWWYDAVGATLPANRISSVNMQLGTGITKPTINQVPFTSTHKYQFTIDTPAAAGSLQLTIPATGMTAPITPSVAGVGIKVTIQDLGEIFT